MTQDANSIFYPYICTGTAGKMQHFGEMLSSIVMPDLETSETESSLEINFLKIFLLPCST